MIKAFDWNRNSDPTLIGETTTSLSVIMKAAADKALMPLTSTKLKAGMAGFVHFEQVST